MAAIVASPHATSIWRTILERTSPAAYIPGTDVSIFSSVHSIVYTRLPTETAPPAPDRVMRPSPGMCRACVARRARACVYHVVYTHIARTEDTPWDTHRAGCTCLFAVGTVVGRVSHTTTTSARTRQTGRPLQARGHGVDPCGLGLAPAGGVDPGVWD